MAIEEFAAVTAGTNAVSNVPRFYEPIVMVRRETGAPFGAAQDQVPALPESISRYQVEASAPTPAQEFLIPISFRQEFQRTEGMWPVSAIWTRQGKSDHLPIVIVVTPLQHGRRINLLA
jgi:hypothetical protein